LDRSVRMKWISTCVISDLLAVCDSHKISFRIVKSRLCSGVKSPSIRALSALPKYRLLSCAMH
jgi:hypothetical protein